MKIAQRFSAGDRDRMTPKSAKRTAEKINKIDGFNQSSANADLAQCLGSAPSAEALGYSQPSASPTFEAKPSRAKSSNDQGNSISHSITGSATLMRGKSPTRLWRQELVRDLLCSGSATPMRGKSPTRLWRQ